MGGGPWAAAAPPRLAERVAESAAFLRDRGFADAPVGMVLGTGLGDLGPAFEPRVEVPFGDIPHVPPATAVGHAGRLAAGEFAGVPVHVLQGRLHMYEGLPLSDVAFPVRLLRALGAGTLVLTNAAGGLDPVFRAGDLMLIDDHLNLMGDNPLRGPNDDRLGPRFPDLSEPYDRRLAAAAEAAALAEGLRLHRGVYAAVCGPALETRAEYRFLRAAGADAVGMSTVPEAIVANHAGMRVLAVAVITDLCLPDALEAVDVAEILRVAGEAGPRLVRLLERTLSGAFGGSPSGDAADGFAGVRSSTRAAPAARDS
jgi:purine-nucleoside phosphorylase